MIFFSKNVLEMIFEIKIHWKCFFNAVNMICIMEIVVFQLMNTSSSNNETNHDM